MKTEPFWTDDHPRPSNLASAALPAAADVAIIGGGYTGLHAARTLAKAGATVVVLEQNTIGWGASSRNGGMLNPGLKESAPLLAKRYGLQVGRQLWEWSLAAIDFVEEVIHSEGIACDFSRAGQVVLAYKPQHFVAMRQEVAWHAQVLGDTRPELVGPAELHHEIGGDSYFGGVLDPRAAGLHPAQYVFGLATAAARAGATLVEQAQVQRLQTPGRNGGSGRYRLSTTKGELDAGEVLLATNGYTTWLVPASRRSVFSAGSYIITTTPLPPELGRALSPKGRMFYDSKHFLNYFRLTPDGRMLFGGRHNLSTEFDLHRSAQELQARMLEVFPELAGFPISHSWTGKLGLTFDLMPHAGRLDGGPLPGIYYAYGYGGHGVGIASYLGHAMGQLIAGMKIDHPILGLAHPSSLFTPYENLYLPVVSAWFRFLDRVS